MNSTANITAAHVSRVLAAGGQRPLPSGTPRSREGIRVTQSQRNADSVRVTIDLDDSYLADARAHRCATILREEGFIVEVHSEVIAWLKVTR